MLKHLCYCSSLTSIDTKCLVSLIIHHVEFKKPTNTGHLVNLLLNNSDVVLRGWPKGFVVSEEILRPEYQPVLLYPSEQSSLLNKDFLHRWTKPIQLIVPDGNWNQASKCVKRLDFLSALPHVRLELSYESEYQIRRTSRPGGLATLEAVAYALEVIEGEATRDHLLKSFRQMVGQVLTARGKNLTSEH